MNKTNLVIDNTEYKDVYIAESFFDRFKGLMFVPKEKAFKLLIKNCNSIHTCFMRFNLDIYCLDKDCKVIKIYKNITPFRFILSTQKVKNILEIPAE